jgi:hypothetical protein
MAMLAMHRVEVIITIGMVGGVSVILQLSSLCSALFPHGPPSLTSSAFLMMINYDDFLSEEEEEECTSHHSNQASTCQSKKKNKQSLELNLSAFTSMPLGYVLVEWKE